MAINIKTCPIIQKYGADCRQIGSSAHDQQCPDIIISQDMDKAFAVFAKNGGQGRTGLAGGLMPEQALHCGRIKITVAFDPGNAGDDRIGWQTFLFTGRLALGNMIGFINGVSVEHLVAQPVQAAGIVLADLAEVQKGQQGFCRVNLRQNTAEIQICRPRFFITQGVKRQIIADIAVLDNWQISVIKGLPPNIEYGQLLQAKKVD
jgi:hypothetical protein